MLSAAPIRLRDLTDQWDEHGWAWGHGAVLYRIMTLVKVTVPADLGATSGEQKL